jgi:hypothetical protein
MADEEIVSRANDMNIAASCRNRRELADRVSRLIYDAG